MTEELARAVRSEAARTVRYWWGVGVRVVWQRRRALGVTRTNNPGTHRLMVAASALGADEVRGKPVPAGLAEKRREIAVRNHFGDRLVRGYHGEWWSEEQLALLGAVPDEDVAARRQDGGRRADKEVTRQAAQGG